MSDTETDTNQNHLQIDVPGLVVALLISPLVLGMCVFSRPQKKAPMFAIVGTCIWLLVIGVVVFYV